MFCAMAFTFVFCYYSGGPTYYRYNHTFLVPHMPYLITIIIIFVIINYIKFPYQLYLALMCKMSNYHSLVKSDDYGYGWRDPTFRS